MNFTEYRIFQQDASLNQWQILLAIPSLPFEISDERIEDKFFNCLFKSLFAMTDNADVSLSYNLSIFS
ncbi:hypothetical protein BCV72DRAFT_134227 [Rhizopus microsporus var. microsporus]|uniref:Uncharacterized protein n=2 Tax=Rhizopus microsporus TaxID=58291 RepID=A0A2G4SQD3_RHIZD|nr:uncharacterized protein RHIMIDRAFT_258667 [Rhizopus microsporus ATCC 52813]ORE05723.1 hypothetical protein BCV72DRAFT_134227 [Rhizopus microsporus var. microsporus]PHZ10989.1 hypothetical protein RHIMIDRAFT_258667 [Rhizopus microsporus ATCC 52813]